MSPRVDLSLQPRSAVRCPFGESSKARRASADPGCAKRSAGAAVPSPPWMRVFKAACMAGCHAQHQQTAFAKKLAEDRHPPVRAPRRDVFREYSSSSIRRSRLRQTTRCSSRPVASLDEAIVDKKPRTEVRGHRVIGLFPAVHATRDGAHARSPPAPAGGFYGLGNIRQGLPMSREPATDMGSPEPISSGSLLHQRCRPAC